MRTIVKDASSRREFLQSAFAAATTAAALPAWGASREGFPARQIIDTHTHFYDPTRPEGVPWPGKDDRLLYRRVLPDDYKAFARPLGVSGTVVVEASPWVEDNQWVLDLAERDPFLVGLVGNLKPGIDEFRERLARFARNKLFRGIRIGGSQLFKELDQTAFVVDLKRLADRDLELDINGGPDMLPGVAKLGRTIPALRIVINHVANVRLNGQAPPADWLEGMRAAAKGRNVFCKVSALVEGTGTVDGQAPADVEFYRPVLDAVWEAFGENRLIYGSNWPVSERFAPYATVQKIVADYFTAKGRRAAEKYFWRNAQAAYKWVKR